MDERIFSELDKVLGDDNVIDQIHANEVRASSLPFCARQYVLHRAGPFEPVQDRNFFGDACMGMGTALHTAAQRFLGHGGLLYGNWYCFNCEKLVAEHCRGPVVCGCGVEATYQEYALSHPCGITAHPDGVVLELPDGTTYPALLEIKGTNGKRLSSMKEPIWRHSTFQANFYLHLVNEVLGLGLDRIVMIYVDRGIPSHRRYFVVRPNRAVYDQTIRSIGEAKEKLRLRVLPERICATHQDGKDLRCQYHQICFVPDEKLQRMLDASSVNPDESSVRPSCPET